MPVEQWLAALPLDKLAGYYAHLAKVAAGFEKDPTRREATLAVIRGWQSDVERLARALEG